MGHAYVHELLADRHALLMLMQGYAAVADPEIQAHVRDGYGEVVDEVGRLSGATPDEVWSFFATGMLLNIVTALDLVEDRRPEPLGQGLDRAHALSHAGARAHDPPPPPARPGGDAGDGAGGRRVRRAGRRPARHRRRLRGPELRVGRRPRHGRARHRPLGVARHGRCSCGSARRSTRGRRGRRSPAWRPRCEIPTSPRSSPSGAGSRPRSCRATAARPTCWRRSPPAPTRTRPPSGSRLQVEREPGVTAGGGQLAFTQVGEQVQEDLARAEAARLPAALPALAGRLPRRGGRAAAGRRGGDDDPASRSRCCGSRTRSSRCRCSRST